MRFEIQSAPEPFGLLTRTDAATIEEAVAARRQVMSTCAIGDEFPGMGAITIVPGADDTFGEVTAALHTMEEEYGVSAFVAWSTSDAATAEAPDDQAR